MPALRSRAASTAPKAVAGPVRVADGARTVYVAIAISGFTALAAQVLWTRLLSLSFGATAYTFSLILGGFLAGPGIGSSNITIASSGPTWRR